MCNCLQLAVFTVWDLQCSTWPKPGHRLLQGRLSPTPVLGRLSRVVTAHPVSCLFCCVSCWARGFFLNKTDSRSSLDGLEVWRVLEMPGKCPKRHSASVNQVAFSRLEIICLYKVQNAGVWLSGGAWGCCFPRCWTVAVQWWWKLSQND